MNSQHQIASLDLLNNLRLTISEIASFQSRVDEQRKQQQLMININQHKQKQKLSQTINTLKSELSTKSQLWQETNTRLQEYQSGAFYNLKQQFRNLTDSLAEKQAGIQNLNKQILKLKNRISSLQFELKQERSFKQNLEQTFIKSFDFIKSQLKQLLTESEQVELDKFVTQTSLKQICDKVQIMFGMCDQMEKRKSYKEEKYQRLKKQNNIQIQNNVRLEIQIQRLKQLLWQQKRLNESMNNKKMTSEQVQYIPNKNKDSRLSKITTQNNRNSQQSKSQYHRQLSPLLNQLSQILTIHKSQTQQLSKLQTKINQMNKQLNEQSEILHQVLMVKQLNTSLKLELNELKQKINPDHYNQYLNNQNPNIYEFFVKKMNEIQHFEQRIQRLESKAIHVTQMIQKILFEGVPQKIIQPDQKELLDKQNIIKSKVKKQMITKFQHQKQIILKDAQDYYKNQIKSLKDKITQLNQQIQRLNNKNQTLFKLLDQKQKYIQNIKLIQIKPEQVQLQSSQQNKKISQKLQTQSIIALQNHLNSQSQQNSIQFLKEKADHFQTQLFESRQITQKYKKQIRFILLNYKVKNTKLKSQRCNQCLFRIENLEEQSRTCTKCKILFHDGQCFKLHDENCKKIKQTSNNNRARQRKPEVKPVNNVITQKIDYF